MAWVATKTWTTGDIVTAAEGNSYWRDDLDYLKNTQDTHLGGDAKAQHTGGLGTHTHQSAGAEGGKIDHGAALDGLLDDDHTQYIKKAGDDGLGQDFKRAIDNGGLVIAGGLNYGARITLYGKDATAGSTGRIRAHVPNAAKNALVMAFEFSGATDAPEMVAGTIPNARLKEFAIGSYTGNGGTGNRQITTGFQCKFVLLRAEGNSYFNYDIITEGGTNLNHSSSSPNHFLASPRLHASDGFWVGYGDDEGNGNGIDFIYLALGE